MNTLLIVGGITATVFLIANLFGEKVITDTGEKIILASGKEALKLAMKPFELVGIVLLMMAERIEDFWSFDLPMTEGSLGVTPIITSRCKDVLKIKDLVTSKGYILMDQLAYLVAFLREYKTVGIPRGWLGYYDQQAVISANALVNLMEDQKLPAMYNADEVLEKICNSAMETQSVSGSDYSWLVNTSNVAAGRRLWPEKQKKPWLMVLSDKGLKAAMTFRDEVDAGKIKVI